MNFLDFKTSLVNEFSKKFSHLSLSYEQRNISKTHCFYIDTDSMLEDEKLLDFVDKYTVLYIDNFQEDDFVILDNDRLIEPRMPEVLHLPEKDGLTRLNQFILTFGEGIEDIYISPKVLSYQGAKNINLEFFNSLQAQKLLSGQEIEQEIDITFDSPSEIQSESVIYNNYAMAA